MKHRHKTHTAGYNSRILSLNTSSILLKSASILSQLRGSSAQCTLSDKLLIKTLRADYKILPFNPAQILQKLSNSISCTWNSCGNDYRDFGKFREDFSSCYGPVSQRLPLPFCIRVNKSFYLKPLILQTFSQSASGLPAPGDENPFR